MLRNMRNASGSRHSRSRKRPTPAIFPRNRPRQQRSQATVDAILGAAAQVLVKHGYDRANTGLIAETAGVSIGSVYQYYPNKEAVFSALLEQELEALGRS